MKKPNLILSSISIVISVLVQYTSIFENYSYLFLIAIMFQIALLAVDSRSLNFLSYNPKKYCKQAMIVSDFIIKLVLITFLLLQYFCNGIAYFILVLTLSILEIFLYFAERKWLLSNAVFDPPPKTEKANLLLKKIFVAYISYLVSVCLVIFPDYNESINWLWLIALVCSIAIFTLHMTKLVGGKVRRMIYFVLMNVSLIWFIIVRYVMEIETPISLFTIIGLTIMLPYFIYISKLIKDLKKN